MFLKFFLFTSGMRFAYRKQGSEAPALFVPLTTPRSKDTLRTQIYSEKNLIKTL